jgi:hypothetical protein
LGIDVRNTYPLTEDVPQTNVPTSISATSQGPPTVNTISQSGTTYLLGPLTSKGIAEKIDNTNSGIYSDSYDGLSLSLSKSGSANGTLTFAVFNSTGEPVSTFGTMLASALTTTPTTYTKSGSTHTLGNGDYVGIKYAPVNGTSNHALKFDGSNDFVALNSGLVLANQTQDLTIEGWIYYSTSGTYTMFGNHQTTTTKGLSFGISATDKLTYNMYGSDASHTLVTQTANNVMTKNAWHQVAVTYNGTQVCFFVDLVQDCKTKAASTVTLNANNAINFRFGHRQNAGAGVEFFNGYEDEWNIYNKVLSSSELQTLYNGGSVVSNLRAHYAMNEGSGTTISDDSGNSFTGTFGTLTAAPTWQGSYIGDFVKVGLLTDSNYGVKFDGVNTATGDYINTNTQTILPNATSTFTFTAWVKHDAQGNGQIMASMRDSTRSGLYWHVTEGDPPGDPATVNQQEIRFYTSNTFGGLHTARGWITATQNVPIGQWTFLAVTFDGHRPTFYENDKVELGARLNTGVGVRQNTGDNWYIGWRQAAGSGFEHFNGTIADVRVYSRNLTSTEINQIYTHLTVADTTGYREHYAMTEGSGTSTVDSQGTQSAATLTNGPTWVYSPTAGTNKFDGTDTIAATFSGSAWTDTPQSDLIMDLTPTPIHLAIDANDSNTATYWQNAYLSNSTDYITADLGDVYNIDAVNLNMQDANAIPSTVELYTKVNSGDSWTLTSEDVALSQSAGVKTISIPKTSVEFIKIQPSSLGTAKTIKINEITAEVLITNTLRDGGWEGSAMNAFFVCMSVLIVGIAVYVIRYVTD